MAKRNDAGGDGPPVPDLIPGRPSLKTVRDAARECRACDLYKRGTQTVFGEGPRRAEVMMVGEQPGDEEDLAGSAVRRSGREAARSCAREAGIDRDIVYVTNVVKHFKWEPRGKRRIHAKPNAAEITACRPWLEAEIALVKPRVLVLPWRDGGAGTAWTCIQGVRAARRVRRLAHRAAVTATVHPSSILRAPDDDSRRAEMKRFVADLKRVAAELGKPGAK